MKRYALLMAAALTFCSAKANAVIVSDNFDSYIGGAVIGGLNWNPKWASGSTQQSLFKAHATGGYAVLDTTVAERNYHVPNQTPFTVTAEQPVIISSDFRYQLAAGGNVVSNANENAFGLLLTDQPEWWNGSSDTFSLSNRGNAMGNRIPFSPWVEGWHPHSTLGINTTTGGLSDWITITWTLTVNGGGTIDATANYNGFDTSTYDTGVAAGTTVYAGYTTDWNNVGGPISAFSNITEVHMDNFSIVAVPEPAAWLSMGCVSLVATRRRRFRKRS